MEQYEIFQAAAEEAGLRYGEKRISITPIMVGDAAKAFEFSRQLFDEGVLALAIGYPTVPEGKARLRTIVTATHKRADLERGLEIFERVGKKLEVI